MVEANTKGPMGWKPAVEKNPTQKARRENVDTSIMGNVRRPFDSSKVRLGWKLEAMADAIEEAGDAAASVPQVERQVSGLMDVAAGIQKVGKAAGIDSLAGGIALVPAKIAMKKVFGAVRRGAETQANLTRVRDDTRKAAEHFHDEAVRFGKWGGDKQMKEMTREPRIAPNRHEIKR